MPSQSKPPPSSINVPPGIDPKSLVFLRLPEKVKTFTAVFASASTESNFFDMSSWFTANKPAVDDGVISYLYLFVYVFDPIVKFADLSGKNRSISARPGLWALYFRSELIFTAPMFAVPVAAPETLNLSLIPSPSMASMIIFPPFALKLFNSSVSAEPFAILSVPPLIVSSEFSKYPSEFCAYSPKVRLPFSRTTLEPTNLPFIWIFPSVGAEVPSNRVFAAFM